MGKYKCKLLVYLIRIDGDEDCETSYIILRNFQQSAFFFFRVAQRRTPLHSVAQLDSIYNTVGM